MITFPNIVTKNCQIRTFTFSSLNTVTGKWRKLHNEELHDLYSSPNIVRVIKSIRMRWAGHVARMGRRGVCIGFWLKNQRERDHWGDPGEDGRIILGWIFRSGLWGCGLDLAGSG
jgi:hypothetical protein